MDTVKFKKVFFKTTLNKFALSSLYANFEFIKKLNAIINCKQKIKYLLNLNLIAYYNTYNLDK